MVSYDYDLFVIGGGSGGVRGARMAAKAGKRVAIAEEYRYGGTCVIRGCVPKKLFVYASHFADAFEDAAGYGWSVGERSFDWPTLIANKDKEIARLEGLYKGNLGKAGAEVFDCRAELVDAHTVRLVGLGKTVTADQILIATGGIPNPHAALPGHEHCITSNEAFHLDALPKHIMIAGGGYIAVEFAGIFRGLGCEVTLVYRGMEILNGFDDDVRHMLHQEMEARGIRILCHQVFEKIERTEKGLRVHLSGGDVAMADQVMLALGRDPRTAGLGLDAAGVETNHKGAIVVDAYSRTSQANIWAVGDVTDRVNLTPVAIHEAMCMVETAFNGNPTRPDHELIPTAVFSTPEIGTVGMTEAEASQALGDIDIYRARFRPMKHTLSGREERMLMKIVVDAKTDRVVGLHILGDGAGEMAQCLGIAVKMGATKADFDRTMAVHPTAAEELVTMYEPSERIRAEAAE
ncbi:glutathione-disulfide reductase [Futiania mangrovi]|uniref:Glutathione reductase n=1 Tax=Futiania mangrovi TaxID=2959716 RepID=A0A9J6P8A6_9PROT|nr:glutathione-disulfide reductase [Futiania mangrovii]MCP1335836.1 glutathione-disulfide reductase [Futiania mangrovii]